MSALSMLGLPFVACLLLTGMLGYLGLHVLKREVIFIDIAVAQRPQLFFLDPVPVLLNQKEHPS